MFIWLERANCHGLLTKWRIPIWQCMRILSCVLPISPKANILPLAASIWPLTSNLLPNWVTVWTSNLMKKKSDGFVFFFFVERPGGIEEDKRLHLIYSCLVTNGSALLSGQMHCTSKPLIKQGISNWSILPPFVCDLAWDVKLIEKLHAREY